jgi:hypothetical protein
MRNAFLLSVVLVSALACSSAPKSPSSSYATAKAFATPDDAANALIAAATNYDVPNLLAILGPDG